MVALKTNWAPNDPGVIAWMNELSTQLNQLNEGTGWRNIVSLLSPNWSASKVQIRRKGDVVTLVLRGLANSVGGAVAENFLTGLPVGWRPAADTYSRPLGDATSFIAGAQGSIGSVRSVTTSASSDLVITWIASGAFPASANYPGVAA